MAESLEDFVEDLLRRTLQELKELHQIELPENTISQIKQGLVSSNMSKDEILSYIEKRKKQLIIQQEKERKVKVGEMPSNFQEIVDVVGILFSDEILSSKLSIYGGTVPYLMTEEKPRRNIGDIDTHVRIEDMPQIRSTIARIPEKYKIKWDTLQATGKEYGFEMVVNGIPVSVFPTVASERGMVVRNFDVNEGGNQMRLVSTLFLGVDEKIETINVNGYEVRIMEPEFTYITKEIARRNKDIEDMQILRRVIRPERIAQMKQVMRKPEKSVEIVILRGGWHTRFISQSLIGGKDNVPSNLTTRIQGEGMEIE